MSGQQAMLVRFAALSRRSSPFIWGMLKSEQTTSNSSRSRRSTSSGAWCDATWNCVDRTASTVVDLRVAQVLAVIENELRVSNRIVTDLLDYARERTPQLVTCPLGPLVTEAFSVVPAPPHVTLDNQVPASGAEVRCLRDPTRGGLAASLVEIAQSSRIGVEIDEARLPVRPEVRGACELLGLDPLFVANEGKLVAFVAPGDAERALDALRGHPLGREAALVGRATDATGELSARTSIGGRRAVDLPLSDPLPRIC
jgi:hypothetical protein